MLKKWLWKVLTLTVIGFLLINPELFALAAFIDAVGLEMYLILLEVQFIAVFGYYFNSWFKPVLVPLYKKVQQFDPYFFIPTYQNIKTCPMILCHAIPGFMLLMFGGLIVTPNASLA